MRIPSGSVDRVLYFIAVDATDLKTRETGLSGFTVYRSRNNGAATVYTTPTVAEISAANMPGLYSLLLDEDTTIGGTHDTEEYVVHITQAAMAPVTRAIDIYRPKITEGQTLATTSVLPWNPAWDTEVESEVADALSVYDPPTFTELDTRTDAIDAAIVAVQADTDNIQTRLPAALVGSKMDSNVGLWLGTAPATPTVAGVPEVDVTHWVGALVNALIAGRVDTNAQVVGDKTGYALTAGERTAIAAALWTAIIEGAITAEQALRIMLSATAGKSNSHAAGTPNYRDMADTKNRIAATTDADGNRTAVVRDGT